MKLAIATGLIGLGVLFTPQVDWKLKIATSLVFATPGVVTLFANEKVLKQLSDSMEGLLDEIEELSFKREDLVLAGEEKLKEAQFLSERLLEEAQAKLAWAATTAEGIIQKAQQQALEVQQEADRALARSQEELSRVESQEQEGLEKIRITMGAALNQAERIQTEATEAAQGIKQKAQAEALALKVRAEEVLEKAKRDTKYSRAIAKSLIVTARSKAATTGAEILARKQQQADQLLQEAQAEQFRVSRDIDHSRSLLEADQQGWFRRKEIEEGALRRIVEVEREAWEKEQAAEKQALERERLSWEEERHLLETQRETAFLKHLEEIQSVAVDAAVEAAQQENEQWREQQLNNVVIPLREEVQRLSNLLEEYRRRYELERDRNQRLILPRKASSNTTAGMWANKLIGWFWEEMAIALNHEASYIDEGVVTVRVSPHPGHPTVATDQLMKAMKSGKFTYDLNIPDLPELDYCEDGWKFVFNVNAAPWGGKPPINEPAVRAVYGKMSLEAQMATTANPAFGGSDMALLNEAREYQQRMLKLNPQLPLSRIPGFNEKISAFEIEAVDWLCRWREKATGGKPNITDPLLLAEAMYGLVINEDKAASPLASTERFLVNRIGEILSHIGFEAQSVN